MNVIAIVLGAALIMMVIERLRPGRIFRKRSGWWLRASFLNLVQAGSVFVGAFTWDVWLPHLPLMSGHEWAMVLQVLAGYFLVTFIYYWWHRLRHENNFLWRLFHQVHHSPARIEIITSFYKHPVEILFNGFLSSFILFVLLGISPEAVAITVLITGLAELFYHWNIRTPYWLGFLFQRPEMHCVHHREDYHRNNYSDLPLWDLLFGTFENPKDQPEHCGFDEIRELKLLDMLIGIDLYRKKS